MKADVNSAFMAFDIDILLMFFDIYFHNFA